ncbi:hypothetical protein BS50DRAFT_629300 [Corynespora cassiicola Philippines]|uniref:Ubiquitin 3 binding protein But2 C-terminal domain-containing protein n=1 Tax=Corynespora cassiicola Philippines TaxID=1448308 RepID=A0A2T2P6N9_CORCC|nr:hypothetical protein BS50DRAFT_629300 [Corynespora cassiicola Philippines]
MTLLALLLAALVSTHVNASPNNKMHQVHYPRVLTPTGSPSSCGSLITAHPPFVWLDMLPDSACHAFSFGKHRPFLQLEGNSCMVLLYMTNDYSAKPILLDTTLERRDRVPANVFANLQTGSFIATSSGMVPCYGPSNYFG